MNKAVRALIMLAAFFLIFPAFGKADIVWIRNGDKLFGKVQNPSFTVQTPYGKILVKNKFLKSMAFKNGSTGRWIIETINNDRFSGTLHDDSIQFMQEDGERKKFAKEEIKRIKREINGPSHAVKTTIFTMRNKDRFSGKFLNTEIKIRANYTTRDVQANEINRIEFINKYQADTKILLENGDLITGLLQQDHIRLAPDAVSEFTVVKSSLKSIQFNAPKMVLKEFADNQRPEKDSDGDGIPDYADICAKTPGGVAVNQEGCAGDLKMAGTLSDGKASPQNKVMTVSANGTPREIEDILFDFDRFELKPRYYSALDEVAAMLAQNPAVKVEIKGYTDNIGTAEYNQKLSEKRARTVKNYFVRKGVERDRLFPVGLGFTMNKAPNDNEAGRALNRRVEFALLN